MNQNHGNNHIQSIKKLTIIFPKYLWLFHFLTLIFPSPSHAKSASPPPNIILILADDLGYGDLGSYGQMFIKTPNLDQMAVEGAQFNQFYSGAATCRPARCTLVTGLHTGNCYARANNLELNLRPQDITIAELLKSQNYRTAAIGKWALGEENTTGVPGKQGFDYFYGYLNQIHAHNYYPDFLIRNGKRIPLKNKIKNPGKHGEGKAFVKKEYTNDLFTNEALKFIRESKDESFFLFLPYTIPHTNNEANELEVPDLYIYKNKNWPAPQKAYAAMVTRLDSYVGNIINELKKHDLEENTIIIFTSDNGPHKESGFNPEFFNSNANLRGFKRDLHEGGIRVPLIIWGPGFIKQPMVSNHISSFPDIFSTIADFANTDIKHSVDGMSFLPTLYKNKTKQKTHDYLYWEDHENGGSKAVRTEEWKSVTSPFGGKTELYNLKTDVSERNNVASQYPDIVLKHQGIMDTAYSKLPLSESFQVFLERTNIINKKSVLAAGIFTSLLLMTIFYITKKNKSSSKKAVLKKELLLK